MIFSMIAIFCCGTFFGAALYISLAQHPATLTTGPDFGRAFFPPMYERAAPMQILLAVLGFISGCLAWYQGLGLWFLSGAILLISVVPITLILIKPINNQLLDSTIQLDTQSVQQLLGRWGP